ncbi:MAG: AIR carboxylase family protein [Klebsiella michiganensis]|nr:AIR carboxylase family protein [Klebsiella michiganensis]
MSSRNNSARIAIVMGSKSDWATMQAGGAAHLPGMIAAKTLVPVLGVPVQSAALSGVDSLYSIVQMPRGIPVGTLAIGKAGAANAALLAAQILAQHDAELLQRLSAWRQAQTDEVLDNPDPRGAA